MKLVSLVFEILQYTKNDSHIGKISKILKIVNFKIWMGQIKGKKRLDFEIHINNLWKLKAGHTLTHNLKYMQNQN